MLSTYNFIVDISTNDTATDEETFQTEVSPYLQHLDALKGAFDRKPCSTTYYPPDAQNGKLGWAVRAVVLISVGAERGENLLRLYQSIAKLIDLELPSHLHFEAEWSRFDFSS